MSRAIRFCVVLLLTAQARAVLRKYHPHIIAVTGSVGKTSTKDAIYTVLSSKFFVRKSEKSFNSEIGVPLTILGRPNGWNNPLVWLRTFMEGFMLIAFPNHYPHWLVLEVGADRPGDIKKVARFVKPDITVMTLLPNIPVHVEYFSSPALLVAEKEHLITALQEGGVAVMSEDDEMVRGLTVPSRAKRITFGCSASADIKGSDESIIYEHKKPAGITFKVTYKEESVPITLRGGLGRQHLYPVLAAIAVGICEGISLTDAAQSFQTHILPPGRMRLIEGKNSTTIIDDTYNSSPIAAEEALQTLRQIRIIGRKIAILADMLELGSFSADEHRRIGALAGKNVEVLWTVGMRAKATAEAAIEAGLPKEKVRQFETSRDAGNALAGELKAGDLVLIKGSQSMRMERAVERAMAHPEKCRELLVRQEPEWRRR